MKNEIKNPFGSDKSVDEKLNNLKLGYEKLAKKNWSSIQKFSKRTFRLLYGLIFMMLILGTISIVLANKTNNLSNQNSDRIKEIASSRKNSILISCHEQNERHEKARIGLENLVRKGSNGNFIHIGNNTSVEEFVDAIAPAYDCKARLNKLLKP